jgi:hypothetical protein
MIVNNAQLRAAMGICNRFIMLRKSKIPDTGMGSSFCVRSHRYRLSLQCRMGTFSSVAGTRFPLPTGSDFVICLVYQSIPVYNNRDGYSN